MTSEVRRGAPFELLAFTAAPVTGTLVVVELEGRVAQVGRFARRPVLVVDRGAERARLELAPVTATLTDDRWHAVYAIPADALPDAHFALGLRGTLLELPAPDQPDDAQRLTALAREANGLRRALEAAEATIAATRAEADDTSAELGAAVAAARDEALAAATAERDEALAAAAADHEKALAAVAAERDEALAAAAADHEQALAAVAAERDEALAAAQERVEEAERRAVAAEERAESAEERTAAAEERARAAEETAQAATAGTDVLRAELAEATRPRPVSSPPGPIGPVAPVAATHHPAQRGVGPWIAVGALVLFAFVLLGLLFGFLA